MGRTRAASLNNLSECIRSPMSQFEWMILFETVWSQVGYSLMMKKLQCKQGLLAHLYDCNVLHSLTWKWNRVQQRIAWTRSKDFSASMETITKCLSTPGMQPCRQRSHSHSLSRRSRSNMARSRYHKFNQCLKTSYWINETKYSCNHDQELDII